MVSLQLLRKEPFWEDQYQAGKLYILWKMCFPFLSPRNDSHLVLDVRMFQAGDMSTDQLATYTLNQHMQNE